MPLYFCAQPHLLYGVEVVSEAAATRQRGPMIEKPRCGTTELSWWRYFIFEDKKTRHDERLGEGDVMRVMREHGRSKRRGGMLISQRRKRSTMEHRWRGTWCTSRQATSLPSLQ
jgi:hypothetical protein